MLSNHVIEKFQKAVIQIVPRCTLIYITDTLPMYIRNVAIAMLEFSMKNDKTVFVYFLRYLISYEAYGYLVGHLVLYSGDYLSVCY